MRWFAILVLAPVTVALAGFTSSPAAQTSLKISYWPNGPGTSGRQTWTLRCDPAGGTLGRPGVACRRLADGGRKHFAPVPDGVACTEIYGGPQVALVVGTVGGKRVWAKFSRTNGCHISRWDRLSPWLLPSRSA